MGVTVLEHFSTHSKKENFTIRAQYCNKCQIRRCINKINLTIKTINKYSFDRFAFFQVNLLECFFKGVNNKTNLRHLMLL